MEEELLKKPKVGATSLFDTTEIETPSLINTQIEIDDRNNSDGNEKINENKFEIKSSFKSEMDTEMCSSSESTNQLRSRCPKRSNRQGR